MTVAPDWESAQSGVFLPLGRKSGFRLENIWKSQGYPCNLGAEMIKYPIILRGMRQYELEGRIWLHRLRSYPRRR